MNGTIFNIQELTFHDGPGGRITVFLKGCPLRCAWCHNPEGFSFERELLYKKEKCQHCNACENFQNPHKCPTNALSICGKIYSSDELFKHLLSYQKTLETMQGGVTFSGGEPLAQYDFLKEVLIKCKEHNLHTCIETSGFIDPFKFKEILSYLDFVIFDIKIFDENKHLEYTKVSNKNILINAQILMDSKIPHLFRTPLIKGFSDDEANLNAISNFLKNEPWEKLEENQLAASKYNWSLSPLS